METTELNPSPPALIYGKVIAIMKDIEPIAKGRKNQQQGYQYRGVDDVMNELSPILAKHGVFPVTEVYNFNPMESIVSKQGTAGYHVSRLYKITLYAEDGSSISGIIEGEASDFGDKAAGKAHSYAYRDFLMKTFCIPTEGDHDTDAKTPETAPKQPERKTSDANVQGLVKKPEITMNLLDKAVERAKSGEADVLDNLKKSFNITPEIEQVFINKLNSL